MDEPRQCCIARRSAVVKVDLRELDQLARPIPIARGPS
jgi:hypothetical protein